MSFFNASGAVMPSKGLYDITITIKGCPPFVHSFYIVPNLTEKCILGLDFIYQHNLLVDGSKRIVTLVGDITSQNLIGKISCKPIEELQPKPTLAKNLSNNQKNALIQLLDRRRDIFAAKMLEIGKTNIVKHSIKTEGGPIRCAPYRTAHTLRPFIKDHINEMFASGVIRPSVSPYAAPIVLAPKKDKGLRFCVDYRKLNKATIKDRYPLPRIDDTIDALHGARYFSTLDLFAGYWQIEIEESDKEKTAFISEFGLYEWNRMPFGLANAPSVFQRLMSSILQDVLYKF